MRILLAAMLASLILPVVAQDDTPLPRPRPEITEQGLDVPLPRRRPLPEEQAAEPAAEAVTPEVPEAAPAEGEHVAEPEAPPRVYQTACPALLKGLVEAEALPPLADGMCGEQSPLALTGVLANGRMVPVTGGVQTDCNMASALPAWVEAVDSYLMARENTRIAEVIGGTSYMCRNVNNGATGNLSFHAFADAIDVVGFKLEDGRTVTVEDGWADALSPEGRLLRFAHGAACAQFTTTLGPEANALHHDHLHLDLGCHGQSCTARICE